MTGAVDTARARLRTAALRHCARCNPSGGDGEPINTGIATGLVLDAAALEYAAAVRGTHAQIWRVSGALITVVAALIATGYMPSWLISVTAWAAALLGTAVAYGWRW